jgi:hypothetical protein
VYQQQDWQVCAFVAGLADPDILALAQVGIALAWMLAVYN